MPDQEILSSMAYILLLVKALPLSRLHKGGCDIEGQEEQPDNREGRSWIHKLYLMLELGNGDTYPILCSLLYIYRLLSA